MSAPLSNIQQVTITAIVVAHLTTLHSVRPQPSLHRMVASRMSHSIGCIHTLPVDVITVRIIVLLTHFAKVHFSVLPLKAK